MKILRHRLLSMLACLLAVACQVSDPVAEKAPAAAVDVCFTSGGAATRTLVGDDGCSVSWQTGDISCLWARDAGGLWQFEAEPFKVYAYDDGRAWFGATLSSAMPEGSYTYYACSPAPVSHNGTSLRFKLPSVQDGKASSGADIMLASSASGPALASIPDPDDHSTLSMSFRHLVHLLRFYMPQGTDAFGGEAVQKIVLTMPKEVAGTVSASLDSSSEPSLSDGSSVITLELSDQIRESSDTRDYAVACIFPTCFETGDMMTAKLYTETKVGTTAPIDMRSRDMAAGHATSVALIPESVSSFCKIYVRVDSNNLGEDVQTVTLTAPEGCKWSDTGSNVYVHHKDAGFGAGESFVLEYEQEASFRTLSGKSVTATYDSEHVTISETLTMPDMSTAYTATLSLNVPYLLFEDFSAVTSFNSYDEYSGSVAGSKSATTFLNGWSGARIGGSAGQCVRLACRRETSADYSARMDSAPLRGTIKSPVNLSVSFDYGADNKYGGLAIITDGNVGQNCYIGYVTDAGSYASGSTAGTFEDDNTFYVKEYTGSYTSTPNDYSLVIHSAPAGDLLRITWRTVIEHQAGTTSTTAWLYVDNVKVKIATDNE